MLTMITTSRSHQHFVLAGTFSSSQLARDESDLVALECGGDSIYMTVMDQHFLGAGERDYVASVACSKDKRNNFHNAICTGSVLAINHPEKPRQASTACGCIALLDESIYAFDALILERAVL